MRGWTDRRTDLLGVPTTRRRRRLRPAAPKAGGSAALGQQRRRSTRRRIDFGRKKPRSQSKPQGPAANRIRTRRSAMSGAGASPLRHARRAGGRARTPSAGARVGEAGSAATEPGRAVTVAPGWGPGPCDPGEGGADPGRRSATTRDSGDPGSLIPGRGGPAERGEPGGRVGSGARLAPPAGVRRRFRAMLNQDQLDKDSD